jgi:hypothetical protein
MYFLQGEITRVSGSVNLGVTTYCNEAGLMNGWIGTVCVDTWNSNTQQWNQLICDDIVDLCNGVVHCPCDYPGEARTIYVQPVFDYAINNAWGNAIYFVTDDNDILDGFIGEITFKPGTYFFNANPLQQLLSLFLHDDINNPPGPSS